MSPRSLRSKREKLSLQQQRTVVNALRSAIYVTSVQDAVEIATDPYVPALPGTSYPLDLCTELQEHLRSDAHKFFCRRRTEKEKRAIVHFLLAQPIEALNVTQQHQRRVSRYPSHGRLDPLVNINDVAIVVFICESDWIATEIRPQLPVCVRQAFTVACVNIRINA